ncbi:50S ribosomal protein L14, partial [Candidatus Pacearchaeota archaeon]|nr:50S ribosomal protein L14 [Candidatus Pacearchaeota archaeon]
MKAISARVTRGLNLGSKLVAADNSGAKIVRLVSVKGGKGRKGRQMSGKVADRVKISVRKGDP